MLILLFILKIVIAQTEWENFYTAFVNNNMTEQESWVVTGAGNENHIYNCSGQQLLGGYNAFGSGTAAQKLFYLPPHYKIRIKLNFWKLGCWDNEKQYIIIDDIVWQQTFSCPQGFYQCGSIYQEYLQQVEIITAHNSETLVILLKSDLNGWNDESWGFNNFTIDTLKCIPGCLLCNKNSSDICQPEMNTPLNWIYSPNIEGWFLTNNSPALPTICLDKISLIGGYQSLGRSSLLRTKIKLDPHYQVQMKFKIWLIDISSVSNNFNIVIDGISHPFPINSASSISFCAASQQESISNIDFTFLHQNPEIEIEIAPTSLIGPNPFWAIFNFNLYVFRCSSHCIKCTGFLKTDCEICAEEWFKENGECNRIQNPLQITKLQLNQFFKTSMLLPIPISFQFKQIELSSYQGFFNRDQNQFQLDIQVQCSHNGLIQTEMHACHSCQSQQINYQTFQCQESIQKFIKLSIQIQKKNITSEEQYLIRTNDTYFLLQQIQHIVSKISLTTNQLYTIIEKQRQEILWKFIYCRIDQFIIFFSYNIYSIQYSTFYFHIHQKFEILQKKIFLTQLKSYCQFRNIGVKLRFLLLHPIYLHRKEQLFIIYNKLKFKRLFFLIVI